MSLPITQLWKALEAIGDWLQECTDMSQERTYKRKELNLSAMRGKGIPPSSVLTFDLWKSLTLLASVLCFCF